MDGHKHTHTARVKVKKRELLTEGLYTFNLCIQTYLFQTHKGANTKAHATQQRTHPVDTERERQTERIKKQD